MSNTHAALSAADRKTLDEQVSGYARREDVTAQVAAIVAAIRSNEQRTDILRVILAPSIAGQAIARKGEKGMWDAIADEHGMASRQARRYGQAGTIMATHSALFGCLTTVTPDLDGTVALTAEQDAAASLALTLMAVIGRNGTGRPAPSADEVRHVARNVSTDPVAALESLIDARPADEQDEQDEQGGEQGGEQGEQGEPVSLADMTDEQVRAVVLATLVEANRREGLAAGFTADEWNTLTNTVTALTAARGKATRRARATKTA